MCERCVERAQNEYSLIISGLRKLLGAAGRKTYQERNLNEPTYIDPRKGEVERVPNHPFPTTDEPAGGGEPVPASEVRPEGGDSER